MKRIVWIVVWLSLSLVLYAEHEFSKVIIGDNPNQIDFITPTLQGEYYYLDQGIQSATLIPWDGSNFWMKGSILNAGYLGFRNEAESLINPIYWGESSVPPLAAFTPLDTDPIGDHLFTNSWLDITSSKVCFTQDRIFFAIKNNHTSFPVSSGLFTYFAYMPVLVNPASSPDENPIVFGLMYTVDVAGIMSPGLYKITGIGFNDLVRLGDIIYSIQDQTLILSCALSDLIADADFSSWYNPSYPLIATTITTSRITLASGTQQADLSAGAKLLLLPHHAQHQNLHTPVLSNAGYSVSTTPFYEFQVQIDFWDADGTFPDLAEVTIDDFR